LGKSQNNCHEGFYLPVNFHLMKRLLIAAVAAISLLHFSSCRRDDDQQQTGTPMSAPYVYRDSTTRVIFPTSFTPNGDGRNDRYRPVDGGHQLASYRMMIYSPGGGLFQSNDPVAGWTGYNAAISAFYTAGIYRAEINFTTVGGTSVSQTLYFTILDYDAANKCWKTNRKMYYFEDMMNPTTGEVDRPTTEVSCP
jgi:hypothetical protein